MELLGDLKKKLITPLRTPGSAGERAQAANQTEGGNVETLTLQLGDRPLCYPEGSGQLSLGHGQDVMSNKPNGRQLLRHANSIPHRNIFVVNRLNENKVTDNAHEHRYARAEPAHAPQTQ